jgi:hypothetical protein
MIDLRRRCTLHRETGVMESGDNDPGARSTKKIMLKSCQTECDRRLPPVNVTVTLYHVLECNDGRIFEEK